MSPRILVVDDEPDIRMLARMILEGEGHEVLEATTGEECLALLEAESPALIFLDIRLPGIDGWQVLERLTGSEAGEPIPIVMMSAHSSAEALIRAQEEGSAGYLVKPFRVNDLLEFANAHVRPGS